MKDFIEALKNNLSNVFSLVGIILTIYFSIFYVPQYINEIEKKKIEGTHESLVEIIQELVYNDHKIDKNDLDTLIASNELSKQIVYPYTIDELLIQVQGEFLNNKFIPLKQRKALVEKIDLIRESIPKPALVNKDDESLTWTMLLSYSVSALGVLIAGLGLSGTWRRTQELKEAELKNSLEEAKEAINEQFKKGIALEKMVYDAIKDIPDIKHVTMGGPNNPVDIMIKTECGTRLGIEAKYTETGVIPIRTINQMISISKEIQTPLLLLANAELSSNAAKKLDTFNKDSPESVVIFSNLNEIDDLSEFIKNSVYKYT